MKQIKNNNVMFKKCVQELLMIFNNDVNWVGISYNNNVVVIEIIHDYYIDKEDMELCKNND